MNKKIISLTAALALFASGNVSFAQAALVNSAPAIDMSAIENRQAFTCDKATGDWSFVLDRAQSALDAVASDYVRAYMGTGTLFFDVSLTGNEFENTALPMLDIYYIGATEVNAHAVSLLIGNTRYDFETTNEQIDIGDYRAELMRAPLNIEGINMINALANVNSYSLMLHGASKPYSFDVKLKNKYDNEKDAMQAASVKCALDGVAAYTALNAKVGADVKIAAWEAANLVKCQYVAQKTTSVNSAANKISEEFGIMTVGDTGTAVKELQNLLREGGYMYAEPTARFSQQTRAAVLRAQKALGLVPTGSADAELISQLTSPTAAPEATPEATAAPVAATGATQADAGAVYEVSDNVRLNIDSYRFASKITPDSGDQTASINVSDADDTFIIFEGSIENIAAATTDVSSSAAATLALDGKYNYDCSLAVQQNDGAEFGTSLLPLGGGKLAVYAEVPKALADATGAWTLTFAFGETTLAYTTK